MISHVVDTLFDWQSLIETQMPPRVPNNDDQEDEDQDEEEEKEEKREPAVIREPDKDE